MLSGPKCFLLHAVDAAVGVVLECDFFVAVGMRDAQALGQGARKETKRKIHGLTAQIEAFPFSPVKHTFIFIL